ncbi:hypothetical protein IEQ34_003103 [Dendrobium chrysotoxum]|uniref:Uncharacterized protein n=1 Tax=Dendrobium chrysotoxum TaxID=161865 RepID=A0AAV7HIV1_DENCH|nr:hypothetical protein IEQ34_003103 [Dendrobium chrysotoxum]
MIISIRSWGFSIHVFSSLQDCLLGLRSFAVSGPFIGNVYCSAVFLSWKSRNKVMHGGKEDSFTVIATNVISMAVTSFKGSLEYWDTNQLL